MAHYAKVDSGIVIKVISADAEFFDTFVDDSPGTWIQTSYNTYGGVHKDGKTPLRKNFASIGGTYDPIRDAFYAPKKFDSWVLNESTCIWEAPVALPSDGKEYEWNETNKQWDEIT
tara:strand:- start:68 stop:415 length:348 start_codon:yes stop_codon:yes gene_type:complete